MIGKRDILQANKGSFFNKKVAITYIFITSRWLTVAIVFWSPVTRSFGHQMDIPLSSPVVHVVTNHSYKGETKIEAHVGDIVVPPKGIIRMWVYDHRPVSRITNYAISVDVKESLVSGN